MDRGVADGQNRRADSRIRVPRRELFVVGNPDKRPRPRPFRGAVFNSVTSPSSLGSGLHPSSLDGALRRKDVREAVVSFVARGLIQRKGIESHRNRYGPRLRPRLQISHDSGVTEDFGVNAREALDERHLVRVIDALTLTVSEI